MFLPPRTLFDLLKNMRTAFDQNLVLRNDFVSDHNLTAFSGSSMIVRETNGPTDLRIWMNVESLFTPVERHLGTTVPSVQFRFSKDTRVEAKPSFFVHLAFQSKQKDIKLQEVEAVFGAGWKTDYPVPLPANWEAGTKWIRYFFETETLTREISFRFLPDGSLSSCSIRQETK